MRGEIELQAEGELQKKGNRKRAALDKARSLGLKPTILHLIENSCFIRYVEIEIERGREIEIEIGLNPWTKTYYFYLFIYVLQLLKILF